MTPVERQEQAQRKTGYGAIFLRREGDYAIVEIEQRQSGEESSWIEVIREHVDSNNFSHIVEPTGILDCIKASSTRRRGST